MKENKQIITTEDFLESILPLIEEGLTVPLKVSGGSMEPFLAHGRDTIHITKPQFPLKKGEMAFFKRNNGRIVMHRICKVKEDGYYFVGDAQTFIEGPVTEKCIFGVVSSVNRKGNTVSKNNFVFWFFAKVWINIIPLRPFIMKIYRTLFSKK